MSSSSSFNDGGAVDPNMRMGDPRARSRYPSPFFDISQQYVPPTVKELFKWVYFYATNNSFLGPALNKIARYPITDLIIEDSNHSIVEKWRELLNTRLQIKTFQMEVNMDLITYGNAFVTFHYPFTRFLVCRQCKTSYPWRQANKKIENLKIKLKCKNCGNDDEADIKDVYYKSEQHVRLVRINPETIDIKYNDATGRHIYLYAIPDKLKRQIMAGDVDILEDTPKIYIDAIKQRKKIKLSNQNLFHLKRPTLAGKDMGWGVPLIATALKDLYYFYTLRRGQEAIINEHIVPFDVIFPQANGKFDPYVHADLSSWRREMEKQLAKKRQDPNYKAVLPFPVGFERIGGDGKALMLTPEMDFLAKTIIGSAGIPQEFVFGGNMQWSGSSISLRTLENDFLHHRSQLLQMIIWISERLRLYLGIPAPKSVKMSDFKMADDMQKLQMMIGMASNDKLDWEDIWKELGRDPEILRRNIKQQKEFEAELMRIATVNNAEAEGQAQRIALRQQAALQEEAAEQDALVQNAAPGIGEGAQTSDEVESGRDAMIHAWARRLLQEDAESQTIALNRMAKLDSTFAEQIRSTMQKLVSEAAQAQTDAAAAVGQPKSSATERVNAMAQPAPAKKPGAPGQSQKKAPTGADMRPLPTQKPPRRQGGI